MLLLVVPTHASGHLRLLPSLPGSPIATSNKLGAPSLSHKKREKKITSLAGSSEIIVSTSCQPKKKSGQSLHTQTQKVLFFFTLGTGCDARFSRFGLKKKWGDYERKKLRRQQQRVEKERKNEGKRWRARVWTNGISDLLGASSLRIHTHTASCVFVGTVGTSLCLPGKEICNQNVNCMTNQVH